MTRPRPRLWPSYLALLTGICALSLSAMFVRWADAPGPITGFYRIFFSTLILTPFLLRRRGTLPTNARQVGLLAALAGIFTACDFAVWNSSLAYTTAANATLLGNTAPLWVAFGAWLIFRERLTGIFWLGLGLTLAGAVLIMGSDFIAHPRLGLGDLLASTAAIFYAAYMLSTQRGREHVDPFRFTWLVGIAASITLLLINLGLGNALGGYNSRTWLIFLGTAVISQIVGYVSISYALGHLPARIVSPTLIGHPVLTTILAIPLLGEIPNMAQALGGLIALTGIYIVNQSHLRAEIEIPNG